MRRLIFGVILILLSVSLGIPPSLEVEPPSESLLEEQPNETEALKSLGASLQEQPTAISLANITVLNSTYVPKFFARTEGGAYYDLTAEELNAYGVPARQQIWGVGIRTKYGILAFYTNDQDSTWGHGQFITYPNLGNNTLPPYNKPILGTFLRLWVHAGGTWYRNWITSLPLYQANGVDIRLSMTAYNTTTYLELGWNATLTIQTYDFAIYNGMRLYFSDHNQIHLKTNITTLDRGWTGYGIEYVQYQSSFWDNTDFEVSSISASNDTFHHIYPLSQFKDMTIEVPDHYNKSQLLTVNGITVHTFDWNDLKQSGLNNTLFSIANITLPNGNWDYVLRTGMYTQSEFLQNNKFVIDPIYTITSAASSCQPQDIVRDSSNRIYVVGKGTVGLTDVDVWHSINEGESWTKYDVATIAYGWAGVSIVIGEYSGTEYVWVTTQSSTYRSTTGDTLSFSSQGSLPSNSYSHFVRGAVFTEDEDIYVIHSNNTGQDLIISKSTNGGSSYSTISDRMKISESYLRGWAMTYPGSGDFIYCFQGKGNNPNAHIYLKRLNTTDDNLEDWSGSAWTDSSETDWGGSLGADSADGKAWIYPSSDTNTMLVGGWRDYDSFDYSDFLVSNDDGETWGDPAPGMGKNNYQFSASTVLTNSSAMLFGSNFDSDLNDANNVLFDYTDTTWDSWGLIWDSGTAADTTDYFSALPQQHNGAVDFAFRWLADSNSTYHIKFYQYEPVSVADTDAPLLDYDTATGVTNSSSVACFTSILVNWSIDDIGDNPDSFEIFSNETGTGNVSRVSGTYSDGDYKSHSFANTNTSNVGLTIFFQIWANDTIPNWNSSIIFVSIVSIFSLTITEDTGTWNTPNVVKGSGVWVYLDIPSKQFLNLSIKGSSNWEVRGYINDTSAELDIKAYITDSSGGSMPEAETWWDSGGIQLTGAEQVITGGDNQAAGDYTAAADQYGIWLVVQVQDGGDPYYGVLLTLVIYQEA